MTNKYKCNKNKAIDCTLQKNIYVYIQKENSKYFIYYIYYLNWIRVPSVLFFKVLIIW